MKVIEQELPHNGVSKVTVGLLYQQWVEVLYGAAQLSLVVLGEALSL